ncbi:hypothetical protein PoB_000255500 [Plakobranchus ocellatus]|uniref:Uncharacterized protein n=1 Tax=Plakobranchus ocellatus TaxID=259542 RepID=A0AAV3XZG2_9GAST|nr:hypothetical protein PoB_000255500 [Plakobranchus ocellatus]
MENRKAHGGKKTLPALEDDWCKGKPVSPGKTKQTRESQKGHGGKQTRESQKGHGGKKTTGVKANLIAIATCPRNAIVHKDKEVEGKRVECGEENTRSRPIERHKTRDQSQSRRIAIATCPRNAIVHKDKEVEGKRVEGGEDSPSLTTRDGQK